MVLFPSILVYAWLTPQILDPQMQRAYYGKTQKGLALSLLSTTALTSQKGLYRLPSGTQQSRCYLGLGIFPSL